MTAASGQSSSIGRFDSRIDAASLATLADLGMSEAQIAQYRQHWCCGKRSTRAGAAAQATI
jgi:hypothetical protein